MDPAEEELQQISKWFSEEGLAADSPTEAQLCLLWRTLQRTGVRLSSVTWDLETQRSQHLAEMGEVRKSLEQIRIFTEHKDVLAQEIQDENDQLKDQLRRLISLQDAQISEVAKMLYQQGLTELIHSSPSEQVAYLLVERASILETSHDADNLSRDGDAASPLGAEAQAVNTNALQLSHKGAPRHGQSPWKRLFGHKASQSKHTFITAETRHLACQASSVRRECSRLERDLEEGSRRLAMAHSEIRRLTDELESAHLTQRAYEPELQAAQQEVEQLRQEVDKVKKYEMVELRKAKELNDRLDLEIRALRGRVRFLDAERGSVQQMVTSLQKELEEKQQTKQQFNANQLKKSEAAELAQSKETCRNLQQELTAQTRCLVEREEAVVCLQKEVKRLELVLKEKQQQLEQQLHVGQSQATELIQSNELCRDLQNKLNTQSRCLLEKESEVQSLKQQLENSQNDLHNLKASLCTKENSGQDQKLWKQKDPQLCENAQRQLKNPLKTEDKDLRNKDNTKSKESANFQEAVKTLLITQDECEMLRKEICETLISLDKERSKNHEMKEKHKAKLCRAREKLDEETMWRDKRIKNLERELSLCSHSLAKEKELNMSVNVENDKLLVERRRLLHQLNEEEHDKKDKIKTASLSKCRVDFLEMENKKLENKLLHMSKHIAALERSLQNMQSLHFTEELKKISNPMQFIPVQTLSAMMPEFSKIQSFLDNSQSKQSDVTTSRHCLVSGPLSRSAEMGYLNLTSTQSSSDLSPPLAILSSSDSTFS